MEKLSILVVEDDPLARKVMERHLSAHSVEFAHDKAAALRKLQSLKPDICFIDLDLGKDQSCSGLELIPVAAARGIYSVVMSGHDEESMVERAYALGCDDFYAKGNEESNVNGLLDRFSRRRETSDPELLFKERFITNDPATRACVSEALKYAASELPLLILGPSGTGKTSLARVIHDHSGRSGEFVAINCSAYSEDLLEAELFGYRKGAFTGASDNRRGKLLAADGGTLFLDEIGSMSLKMQTKLLKAIEERSFYPLGSDRPETSRFRLVSATLEDLQSLIRAGRLRFDFFQRIHGLTVSLKPLAQRKGDIGALLAFLTRGGKKLSFSPEAKEVVMRHDWPGNIRELKKFVDMLVAGGEGRVGLGAVERLLKTIRVTEGESSFVTDEQYRCAMSQGLEEAVDRFVDTVIKRNLAENDGKKTKTLEDLKISTRLLYASLKRFEIPGKKEPGS
jgi:DNA-binding NtrC family response regulator